MRDFNTDGILVGRPDPIQAVHEISSTENWPIGTIHERHGRRWRYCKAIEAITVTHRGCVNSALVPWNAENVNRKITAVSVQAAGDDVITVTHGGTDVHPIDFFAGGMLVLFYSTDVIWCLRVSGNDASAVGGLTTKLYLDEPLPAVTTAAMTADLHISPYAYVAASGGVGTYGSVVCVPMVPVTINYYFWGQTRGPCWVTPTAGITAASTRSVAFHTDGTIKAFTGALQYAGYLIDKGDGSQDDALIMLALE